MIKSVPDVNPYSVNKFLSEDAGNLRIVEKEYSALRKLANQRVERLKGSKFSNVGANYKNAFPKLKDIKSKRELSVRLSEVTNFINSPRSTISGNKAIRKKTIETLQDRGFEYVDEDNFDEFTDFMDMIKSENLDRMYGSEQLITDVFQKVSDEKKGKIKEALNIYVNKKRKGALSKAKEKRRKAQAEKQRKAEVLTRNKTQAARNAKQKNKGRKKHKR